MGANGEKLSRDSTPTLQRSTPVSPESITKSLLRKSWLADKIPADEVCVGSANVQYNDIRNDGTKYFLYSNGGGFNNLLFEMGIALRISKFLNRSHFDSSCRCRPYYVLAQLPKTKIGKQGHTSPDGLLPGRQCSLAVWRAHCFHGHACLHF